MSEPTRGRFLIEFKTYDTLDISTTGFIVEFYEEPDYAVITNRSRWQGSVDGRAWRCDSVPSEVMAAARRENRREPHGHEPDLGAAVDTWLRSRTGGCSVESMDQCSEFHLIRTGSRIGG